MQIPVPGGVVDTQLRTLTTPTGTHALREKEARLVEVLVTHGGTVSREQLLTDVFDYDQASRSRTLVTTIARTRQAFEQAGLSPDHVQTVYGEGYRWVVPPPVSAEGELFGRESELHRLTALLADPAQRLITLVGRGGIGKSRLARHLVLGRQGVVLVELAGIEGRAAFERAVLAALESPVGDEVAFALGHRGVTTLILDNVEQLLAPVRTAVPSWSALVPGLRVLATSRCALHLPGEVVVEVGPLPEQAARALFLARAKVATPDADADLVPLLAALDHHPLAIELAAARTLVHSLAQLRARLAASHDVLVDPSHQPARHGSSNQVVDDSLALLDPDDLHVLLQVQVFAGTFTLDQLLLVARPLHRPIDVVLDVLLDHHLVLRRGTGVPRFRVHEAVRSALRNDAQTSPLFHDARARFVEAMAADAVQAEVSGTLAADDESILAAVQHALAAGLDDAAASILQASLPRFERAHPPETLRPFIDALTARQGLSTVGLARLAIATAWSQRLRDPDHALGSTEQAVDLARLSRDDLLISNALEQRAQVLAVLHRHDDAKADLHEASFRHRAAGRREGIVRVGLLEGVTAIRRWDMEAAARALAAIAGEVAQAGFEHRFRHQQVLVVVAFESEQWDACRPKAARLVELSDLGTREHRAWALLEHAFAHAVNNDLATAATMLREASECASQAWLVVRILCNIYGLEARDRHWDQARRTMDRCLEVAKRAGGRAERLSLLRAGWLARLSGDLPLARSCHRSATPDDAAHVSDLTEQALLHAQEGELSLALEAQQRLVDQLAGSGRTSEQLRADCLMAELELAAGLWDHAEQRLRAHAARPNVQPYERPRLDVLVCAATGTPGPLPKGPDPLSELDLACWMALAHRRAGDEAAAAALLVPVQAALELDQLPPTSELAWRLRAVQTVALS